MITSLTILFAVGISKWAIAPVVLAAGISALSQLVGHGISSAQNEDAANARERYLNRRRQEENDWYNRNYNADPTQRADAQRAINMVSEEMKRNNRAIAGRAAMGGATEEAVAQEKALGNQALADVVSSIAAEGSKRKDAIDAQHHQAVQGIDDAEFGMREAENARKAQNLQTAMASAGNLAATIAGNSGTESAPKADNAPATPMGGQIYDAPAGSQDSKTQLNQHKPQDFLEQPLLA